jgi:thiosulfate reductase cytochrome b subunit
MLPVIFHYIFPSCFRGDDFYQSTNQKQELHIAMMFLLIADNAVFQYSNANDMHVTQDLSSFREDIAHAQCSVDEKNNIYILVCTT